MKKRRLRKALFPALVLGGLLLVAGLGASPAAAATDIITKTGPASGHATAGQNFDYTIQVTNNTGSDDHNVIVTDTLSAKVTYVSDTGGCTGAPNLSCNLGTIADGASKSFVITVKVKTDSTGTIANQASVDGDDTDSVSSNTVNTTIDTSADLSVTKSCSPSGAIAQGSTGTCQIIVHNSGPSDATNVSVSDHVSSTSDWQLTAVGGDGLTPANCGKTLPFQATDATLTCTFTSPIASGGNGEIDLTFKDATASAITLNDTSTVSSDVSDSGTGNNVASDSLEFDGTSADLRLTKACVPATVAVGNTGTCTITLHNFGPSDATTVTVNDQIQASANVDITNVVITPNVGTCVATPTSPFTSTLLTCTGLGPIASGSEKTIAVTFAADVAGTAIDLSDTATVTSSPTDPNTSNNSASAGLSFASASADLSVTKVCKPDTTSIPAGTNGSCLLQVTNNGPDTAANLTLTDHLFSNAPFTIQSVTQDAGSCPTPASVPTSASTDQSVICTLASLAKGGHWNVTVAVQSLTSSDVDDIATIASSTADPVSTNNTATGGLTFLLAADLQVTKVCKPDTSSVPAGTTGRCQLLIHNNSQTTTATNVHLVDSLFSSAPFTIEAIGQPLAAQGTCTPSVFPAGPAANQVVDCTLASLGANATWEVDITVKSLTANDVDDTAFVSSDISDPNTGNNTTTAGLSFTASADLQVTKTANPSGTVVAGTSVTYTVTVKNNGPSAASAVVVTDTLPAGVTFDSVLGGFPTAGSVNPPPGGGAGGTVTWNVGDMASGATEVLEFQVVVNPQTTGSIANSACASSQTSDPVNSNNCSTATNGTSANAVLTIDKDGPSSIDAGADLTYTIVVTNSGPSTAKNVVVTDNLPSQTTFVSGVDQNNTTICTQIQVGVIKCALGTIDPLDSRTILITAHVKPNAVDGSSIQNCASVASTTPDSNAPPPSCVQTDITTEADLWIDKQGVAPAQNPAGALIYTITVHNQQGFVADATPTSGNGGPSNAQGVSVTDQLPLPPKKLKVQFMSPGCTNTANNLITCQIPGAGTLPVGTNVSWQIQVQVQGTQKVTLINTATLHSTTADPDATNNSDTVNNVVQGSTGKGKRP